MQKSVHDPNDHLKYNENLQKSEFSSKNDEIGSSFGVRHIQILLIFLSMTGPGGSKNPSIPTYPNWTNISTILSSYLWGFVVTELFGGYLAQRFGFKWFLVISMGITSIFTYSLPQLTEQFGYYGIIFCRMIQGFCQGIVYPMLANFLSKWVPEEERSFATTFVYAGGDLGTVIATALAGYYASSRLGWPFTFSLYGILGGIWTIMFAIFGSNSPETHRGISEYEVWHITKGKKPNKQTNRKKTPWKKIFTSLPVWSLWICTISSYWGYWILSMEVPLFMSDILGFNISLDSFYMTLVYFVSWLMSFPSGGCTQFIINRNIATVGNTRKIINSIAFFIPGLCLIGIGVIQGSDYRRCVTLLIVAIIFDSFQYSSYYPNYIDISPHYCGTLFGIGQWVATVFTIFCPLLRNSTLREREQYSSQWENLFLYTAAMYFISNIIYLIFGTGKIQEWNFYDEEDDDDANESTMLLFQRTKNEGP